jgi:hypothetical protein
MDAAAARYDEALERLHAFGPEFRGGLSNHGPMALDALFTLGFASELDAFARRYEQRLERAEIAGRPLTLEEQTTSLGDFRRHDDWVATFRRELAQAGTRDVLRRWIPVLAPGVSAAALHGPLRACYALRALARKATAPRVEELARGLAYWAARYVQLPGEPRHGGGGELVSALIDAVPLPTGVATGLIYKSVVSRTRRDAGFSRLVSRTRAPERNALGALAVAGARALIANPSEAIVFTHAVTGPSLARELQAWLAAEAQETVIDHIWQAIAGLVATYAQRRGPEALAQRDVDSFVADRGALVARVVDCGDEHAIKLMDAVVREEAASTDPALAQAAAVAYLEFQSDSE